MAKVLVVDDDPDIRGLVRLQLSTNGHSVMTAASGPEALALIEGNQPDAVLLDLCMPGMDGIGFLEELHSKGLTGRLPVVMFSGGLDADDALEKCVALGCRGALAKPYREQELLDAVRRVLP